MDTLGLLLFAAVTAGNVDDAKAAEPVLARLTGATSPRLEVIRADSMCHDRALNEWPGKQRRHDPHPGYPDDSEPAVPRTQGQRI